MMNASSGGSDDISSSTIGSTLAGISATKTNNNINSNNNSNTSINTMEMSGMDAALLSAWRDPRERRTLFRLEQLLVDFMASSEVEPNTVRVHSPCFFGTTVVLTDRSTDACRGKVYVRTTSN